MSIGSVCNAIYREQITDTWQYAYRQTVHMVEYFMKITEKLNVLIEVIQ